MVEFIPEKHQAKGNHKITWHTEKLPSGFYYCVLTTDKEMKTTKMIKL